MRKILTLLLAFFLLGCQSAPAVFHVDEYSGPLALSSGWKGAAFPEGKQASLSFRITPEDNFAEALICSIEAENGHLSLRGSGMDPDGSHHGLSVEFQSGDTTEWAVCDAMASTYKENYLVLVLNERNLKLYLNNVLVLDNTFAKSFDTLKQPELILGDHETGMHGTIKNLTYGHNLLSAEEINTEYYRMRPQILLDEIEFDEYDDVREEFWVYPMAEEYRIDWTSSDPDVLEISRNLAHVTIPETDTEVTFTAKITTDLGVAEKSFTFMVRADNEKTALYRDSRILHTEIGRLLNDGQQLPEILKNGTEVVWTAGEGDCTAEDGILHKNTEEERTTTVLQAVLTNGDESMEMQFEAVVLDAYAGYVLAYFNGDTEAETGKLAYSYDGLHWTDLNHGETVISADCGSTRVRDPFVGRDAEGNFVVLATEGYDNPHIYLYRSEDLLDLSHPQMVEAGTYDPALKMTGERAWAPEMVYDAQEDLYYVFYSDSGMDDAGILYCITTKDFETWSYPQKFFEPGYPVIDGTVIPLDGYYWLFYKDEREGAQTIFYASTSELADRFGLAYDSDFIFSKKRIEGPFTFRDLKEDKYWLYVDNYSNHTFYVGSYTRLGSNADFHWLEREEYELPNEDVRHGSAIAVTQKELERLLEKYGND